MASSLAALSGLPMAAARPLNPSPCVSFSRSGLFGRSLTVTPAPLPTTTTTATLPYPSVFCGRGDRKTAKGKRFNHSFGNARPKDKKKGRGPPRVAVPPAPPRKDKFDDGEIVKIEIDESLFSS